MTISMPLVVVLGIAVVIAWRYLGLRAWQAAVCLLCGFLLAATAIAPDIDRAISALLTWLTGA